MYKGIAILIYHLYFKNEYVTIKLYKWKICKLMDKICYI